ncbi:hypothetical protein DCAR_0521284 [Daucus carota subsp. sativus]|uniref:Uncharacterized protein n=1 Tax=Daucus carota subsp. sativus TaxID=79200 RepID=A0AAF1B288_DAUCS|nr:PREDICTED: uncharacterized protein LOC108220102 [Daucus carota subsp. sativus]WOH01898.1 hypothetical protein DCAR_0521284 [Daucus carota subsp. sativus]
MATTGRSTAVASVSFPSSSCLSCKPRYTSSVSMMVNTAVASHRSIACSAVQESSASASASTVSTADVKEKPKPKAKPPAKAPAKPLPQMMEEDVIPPLKSILETQEDISEIELSFEDNRLYGSFVKKNIRYSFWAFFPDGVLTGPKGFSLSSYGSEVSTLEPFLIDEKKITAKHIVFWVEKRLAAQGIIPVWRE